MAMTALLMAILLRPMSRARSAPPINRSAPRPAPTAVLRDRGGSAVRARGQRPARRGLDGAPRGTVQRIPARWAWWGWPALYIRPRMRGWLISCLLLAAAPARADCPRAGKTMPAAHGSIEVDGKLDDRTWATACFIEDFEQKQPAY